MTSADDTTTGPETIELSGQISAGAVSLTGTLTVIQADDIEVGDSDAPKYLRLRNGDFRLSKRVFLVVDGARVEITVDELPPEQ